MATGHTMVLNEVWMQVLLYDKDFPDDLNKDILLSSLRLIHQTSRLDLKIPDSLTQTSRPFQ